MYSDMAEPGKVSLSLRWGSHQETLLHSLENCFGDQDFVDLTLACEGQSVQAHRVVVSACSSFLKKLLQDHPCPHPIIILKDITMCELKQLLEFMYCGQVTVEQWQLESLLHAAQILGVRGLTDVNCSKDNHRNEETNGTTNETLRNVTISGNKSILARYLSTPPSTNTLSLAQLLSQPALNTNLQDQENCASLSEVDLDVKQEKIDIESEFQDTQNEDGVSNLDANLNPCSNTVGKATAFMLTLARRAHHVAAAVPYSAHGLADVDRPSSLLCDQNIRDVHDDVANSGHSRAGHKLAFYESRPCSVCGKMYRDAASLRTHMSIMHTTWRDGFECSCKQVFETKYQMYQHRKSHAKSGR